MRAPLFLTILCTILLSSCSYEAPVKRNEVDKSASEAVADTVQVKPKSVEYDTFGFPFDSSLVRDYKVKRNESLYTILNRFDFSPGQIHSITNKAKKVFDVRSFKPGQKYRVYASADSTQKIARLVWQPRLVDYVVFDLQDSLNIYKEQKEVTTRKITAAVEINNSLYEAMAEEDMSPLLAYKLSEIYAWQIDFFSLRKGDGFKVLHEEKFVDGEYYGPGDILAVEFIHRGESYNAYKFGNDQVDGYFDEEGKSVEKALLKAPFSYNQRISSGYSRSRFHPVLKRRMPHYGVDYAAPHGTPVLAVGDGTVMEAQYRGANGNIVKIRHNGTYQTAYLHLKGFAQGIRRGASVKQGQIIGYVGKTGRVTGTHLDYRIYKNGRPVNPLTVDLPASRSVPEESAVTFDRVRERYKRQLDEVSESPPMMITRN